MRSKMNFQLVFTLIFLLSGCAALQFKIQDVAFENPAERFGIVKVDPTPEELVGVNLRLLPSPKGFADYREEDSVYADIKNGKGKFVHLVMNRRETYKPGSRPDSYLVSAVTTLEKAKGNFTEEFEQTAFGEIVKFVNGYHYSDLGKLRITNWERTPVMPGNPALIGNEWSYREAMTLQIDSKLVKDLNPMGA